MRDEELRERLYLTAPTVEEVVREWVEQIPDPCSPEEAIAVLHGPIPLAHRGPVDRPRFVATWALYEWRDGRAEFWIAHKAFRWRWRALRAGRRQGAALLAIRRAVKEAERMGR